MSKVKVGIIGATGYTGSELVRLLLDHPEVEIKMITSESRKGEKFSDVHPQFREIMDIQLVSIEDVDEYDLDLVFLALPHGVSMDFVKDHYNKDFKIVDLSGDFRLSGKEVYESWYKKDHTFEKGFETAVFGLPELYRDKIKKSSLVANPGCFPTSSILPLAPLLREGIVDVNTILVDSKTGVTGAGIKAKPTTHFPNVNDNFAAYGVRTHRHTIEIQEIVSNYSGNDASVLFTPHLLPVDRGILSTIYTKPNREIDQKQLETVFKDYYGKERFIRLTSDLPSLKNVRGTNYCDIYATYDDRTNTIITISVIDNLVKGAAGQAIQNMNIMMKFAEDLGLKQSPLQP